jgi:ABC-type glycerol-3-phosphate transport system substrate-binding protein
MKKGMLILMAAILAFGLVSCGQQDAAAPEVVEKTIVLYNSYNGDPIPRKVDEAQVAKFMEMNENVEVVHSIVAHEDFKQAIRAYLTASAPPDVLTWFAGNRSRFFIDKGLILDISDVWEEQGWNESYAKGWQAMSSVDGKKYFLPTAWYWWAVYYNQDVFEEYGLEAPETWDEFMAVCDTLVENGIKPFTIGTKYRWTAAAWFDYMNMRINGPEFHVNLMLGTESYSDERVKKVFREWGKMIDKGYFIDDPAAYTWQEAIPFMANGEAAMYLMGDFIRDSYPEESVDRMDFFRFPIFDPSVPIGEDAPTDGYFIPANTQNPEEAKALLAFLGSAESQTMSVEEMGRMTTNSDVDRSLFNDVQKKGFDLIDGADFVAQFYDRDTTPEMADVGMNGFMEFWENHSESDIDRITAKLEATRLEVFTE